MSTAAKMPNAIGHVRLLCCTAVAPALVIPEVLAYMHRLVHSAGWIFVWLDARGDTERMWCAPLLRDRMPYFFAARERMMQEAGYQPGALQAESIGVREMTTRPQFRDTEMFRQLCLPCGVAHGWDGLIRLNGRVRAALVLWREPDAAPVSDTEAIRVRMVFPYLAHLLAAEPAKVPRGVTVPDPQARGLLICDEKGRIMHASPVARELLGQLAHPGYGSGTVCGDEVHLAVKALIQQLLGALRGRPGPCPQWSLSNEWGHFDLRGYWLDPENEQGHPLAGIQLTRRIPATLAAARRLERLPLSVKQKELCLQLVRRQGPRDIEVALGIKPSTQKDYAQRIYEKLGVSHRDELLDLLLEQPSEEFAVAGW